MGCGCPQAAQGGFCWTCVGRPRETIRVPATPTSRICVEPQAQRDHTVSPAPVRCWESTAKGWSSGHPQCGQTLVIGHLSFAVVFSDPASRPRTLAVQVEFLDNTLKNRLHD